LLVVGGALLRDINGIFLVNLMELRDLLSGGEEVVRTRTLSIGTRIFLLLIHAIQVVLDILLILDGITEHVEIRGLTTRFHI
jgi:hypothetical protein